jgi:hypothetical protein
MADTASTESPPPLREALIYRDQLLLTATWSRWIEVLWRRLGQAQGDIDQLAQALAALAQPQTTTLTMAVSGAAVLTFAAMAPAGVQVVGVTWRISTTFTGTLTGLMVGDATVNDRWGIANAVTAGTTGGSAGWRGAGGFTVPSAYTVLVAPRNAGFGAAGALTCQCTWWPALLPPP